MDSSGDQKALNESLTNNTDIQPHGDDDITSLGDAGALPGDGEGVQGAADLEGDDTIHVGGGDDREAADGTVVVPDNDDEHAAHRETRPVETQGSIEDAVDDALAAAEQEPQEADHVDGDDDTDQDETAEAVGATNEASADTTEAGAAHGATRAEVAAEAPRCYSFGPFIGEFGWRVMAWAPYVKGMVETMPQRQRETGDRCVIIDYDGMQPLYQEAIGMGAEFLAVPHDVEFTAEGYGCNAEFMTAIGDGRTSFFGGLASWALATLGPHAINMGPNWEESGAAYANKILQTVQDKGWLLNFGFEPTRSLELASGNTIKIGVIARDRAFAPDRNYPDPMWEEALANLQRRLDDAGVDYHIRFLGAQGHVRAFEGTRRYDMRTAPNEITNFIDEISQCNLILGESSGGMHLALATGQPCVVFGEDRIRPRYHGVNWHDAPLHFIGSTRPGPAIVARQTHRMIAALAGDNAFRPEMNLPTK
jgi:hypothetical protein